ncbi:MAG: beta-ketoacyl synthase N-terminal-like domain-containing protein [Pseudomonadota bacterium]
MKQRIFITAADCLTSLGDNLTQTWDSIIAGKSGIAPTTLWDCSEWEYPLVAEVKNYNPRKMLADRKLLKMLSRHDVIGLKITDDVVKQSGLLEYRDSLADTNEFNFRTGLFVASAGSKFCQQNDLHPLLAAAKGDLKKYGSAMFDIVHPMWLLRILSNNVIAYAGIKYQFRGTNQNVVNHAVSGIQAIAEAQHAIEQGVIDRALVIGYESAIEPEGQMYYASMNLLSPNRLSSFDKTANGTILGEGAGALMLENQASVQARQAPVLGEILSSTSACEAQGTLQLKPNGEGITQIMQDLLAKAAMPLSDLGMITAHANANKPSDASELSGYKALNEAQDDLPPITGFKGYIGHTVAAAGVVETILTLKALQTNTIPGVLHLQQACPEVENLKISAQTQRPKSATAAVINRAFASVNAGVLLRAEPSK